MPRMHIFIFNCGSSSVNYKLFEITEKETLKVLAYGKAHRVGVQGSEPSFIEHHLGDRTEKITLPISNHRQAAALILDYVLQKNLPISLVGHRFVHGGPYFKKPALMTAQNLEALKGTLPLAPIHNPNSMSVIEECQNRLPAIPEYASFDTTFHASLPDWSYTYPLPDNLVQKYSLRKYGFHGLSYQFICQQVEAFLRTPVTRFKMIACHLGTGGSSVTAIQNGQSRDTSMGYSPLPGLMMSTRCGDLDPLLPLSLMENESLSAAQINGLLNKKSGLLGVSGFSSDIRDIIQRAQHDQDPQSILALEMYVHRLRKYIGAFTALMGGVDVLVFTDDIGVQNPLVRQKTCAGLDWCGLKLDETANLIASTQQITAIQHTSSRAVILATPTDEEWVIGMEGLILLKEEMHVHF
jgi:acetate kinase